MGARTRGTRYQRSSWRQVRGREPENQVRGLPSREGAQPEVRPVQAKFRNKRTDGFDSKKEAKRAGELKILERDGTISDLKYQVKYELIPKQEGERACGYIADFTYTENGEKVVEDVKGFKTPEYVIKRKLMLHKYGIRVREV